MGRPVVHFEIVGPDPGRLRGYYGELFGWEFSVGDALTEEVSRAGAYGFVDGRPGINGGVGGGAGFVPRALFYVGVDSVADALGAAERLGGTRVLGPVTAPGADYSVGRFIDPAGNLVGVAGGK